MNTEQHPGVVYKITCLITGEKYTGSTIDYDKRMGNHRRGETGLRDSVAKHGWENHEHVKLMQGIPIKILKRCEFAFQQIIKPEINKMQSTAGGCVRHAESSIEKIRQAKIGKPRPPETRAKISASTSGERNPNFGKPRSPETLAKIGAGNRGKKQPPEAIAKTAAANRGKKHSLEARAKMHESQKEQHRTKRKHRALKELRSLGWPVAA